MGVNDQTSLVMFEQARRQAGLIPPQGSNSFYKVGDGEINLLVKREDPGDYRFDLFTNKGSIFVGPGNFIVAGDISDILQPYENLIIIANTSLAVNNMLTISKGKMDVHGTLELMPNSQLVIKDGAQVTMFIDSTFVVRDNTKILVEKGSSLTIYGEINVHLNMVDALMNTEGITIDSAAVMSVDGLEELGPRPFSITDYEAYLRTQVINMYTQGEINRPEGRMGYTWVDGTPLNKSQLIDLTILNGEAILGDFKLSILGYPEKLVAERQTIRNLKVNKGCTMYITEQYKGCRYIRPDLYLGVIIGNCKTPSDCTIDGTMIVDGKNSFITVDRGSTLHLSEGGELVLRNSGIVRSTHNDPDVPLFFIDGTLYIEDISQISTFTHDNIVIGENGKVVIYNPDTGEKRVLWSTPNGIEETDLYRLFKDRIDHVEYHISNNTGIAVDQNFEYFNREFTQWYGGRRIEQAIHDGILVWHSGGFIELNHDVIPWVTKSSTLLDVAKLFKVFGTYDHEKLQECADHFRYAGAGNIVFRFVEGKEVSEVTLVLEDIQMTNVYNHPLTNMYTVDTTNDGQLFMRNKVTKATIDNIVHPAARVIDVEGKKVEFPL